MPTATDRSDLYVATSRCDACVRVGNGKILRDKDNLPQPGFVGRGYDDSRILIIGQNPGAPSGDAVYTPAERAYTAQLRAVAAGEARAVERLNEFQAAYMVTWRIHGQCLGPLLAQSGLALDDVAYLNAVRCRTRGNAAPPREMVSNCSQLQLDPWLRDLQPRAAVCLGVAAARMVAPALAARGIPMEVISRERSLDKDTRHAEIQRVAAFVRQHRAP